MAILEHQGVEVRWFKELQDKAISEADNMFLSISDKVADFFTTRHLGRSYRVDDILRYLANNGITRPQLQEAPHPWLDFYLTSIEIARVHVYRELKYRARIPVPSGYSLVGVADIHDELKEGEVYSQSIQFHITAAPQCFQSASRSGGRRASTFLVNQA